MSESSLTRCDYCDRRGMGPGDVLACVVCGAMACALCSADGDEGAVCNPDPATWPGQGCYKPPVAEVAP